MIIEQAKRLDGVSEYYFSAKLEQIRQMNEAGQKVINLGFGSPDLAPREEVIQIATQSIANQSNHGYGSYRSLASLRLAISYWYSRVYEVNFDSEKEVLPLLGSKEGLFYIAMSFLNPGDKALVPNPGYPAYASVTRLAQGECVDYELSEKNSWMPDFELLEKMDLSKVKLMWVNYPHMPSGASGSPELFKKLIEFGRRHKILICHDNPYGMILNDEPPLSILKFDPSGEVALELNSMSKAFNMAGWRVGMLLANSKIIDTVLKVKSNVDSGMFTPIQHAAIEALNAPDEWHAQRNNIYRERRVWAEKIFELLRYKPSPNQVGLFVWAKAPTEIQDVEQHINQILTGAKVFLTPGFIFGSSGSRYARCSLCAPIDKIKEAYQRLEKFK